MARHGVSGQRMNGKVAVHQSLEGRNLIEGPRSMNRTGQTKNKCPHVAASHAHVANTPPNSLAACELCTVVKGARRVTPWLRRQALAWPRITYLSSQVPLPGARQDMVAVGLQKGGRSVAGKRPVSIGLGPWSHRPAQQTPQV